MSTAVLWSRDDVTLPADGPDKAKLSVRWHNKLARPQGNLDGDYVDILEGLDRIVLNQDQLDALGIDLLRGDIITFPKYGGFQVELDQREPGDGPKNVYWHVTRP